MTYQVANGSIPATVERFLRERCGLHVQALGRSDCSLNYTEMDGERIACVFDWPHDREPTLQEAIEAVVAQR